jgi:hypothetical protein
VRKYYEYIIRMICVWLDADINVCQKLKVDSIVREIKKYRKIQKEEDEVS